MMDPGWDEMDLEANIARRSACAVGGAGGGVGWGLRVREGRRSLGRLRESGKSFSSLPFCGGWKLGGWAR